MNYRHHPSIIHAQEIANIAKPLEHLGIDYFSHVKITEGKHFSAIGMVPEFVKCYLDNQFFNEDIHNYLSPQQNAFILWDLYEGKLCSEKVADAGDQFGQKKCCTIILQDDLDTHYYHFSTQSQNNHMNQRYLDNQDLLHLFINHFKKIMQGDVHLQKAYDYKFPIQSNTRSLNYPIADRYLFMKELFSHIPNQQLNCLKLLAAGYSVKGIANQINLSPRTVEHYLERLRLKLNCKNGKDLIAYYYSFINTHDKTRQM
jgi:DNA-binding CsgD family transcriptional regulator